MSTGSEEIVVVSELADGGKVPHTYSLDAEEELIMELSGYGKKVNEKLYQITPSFQKQIPGNAGIPKPISPGGSRVFETSQQYNQQKQAIESQTKRPYLNQMAGQETPLELEPTDGNYGGGMGEGIPAPDMGGGGNGGFTNPNGFTGVPRQDELPEMMFGQEEGAPPKNNSDGINGTVNKTTAILITDLLLKDIYPEVIFAFSKSNLEFYADKDLPVEWRMKLQGEVDNFNRRIKNNCDLDRDVIAEFRDALTDCLNAWGMRAEISPEWRLGVVCFKIIYHGITTCRKNRRERDNMDERWKSQVDDLKTDLHEQARKMAEKMVREQRQQEEQYRQSQEQKQAA